MAKLTFGSCYFESAAAVETDNIAGVPIKAAGTTTAMKLEGFTHTNGRLTCTGVIRTYEVQFNGNVSKGGGGATVALSAIFKNGAAVVGSGTTLRISSSSDHRALAILCHADLGPGDYVEIWVQTDTGDNITIDGGVLSVKVIG
jgi:hypothetical protein